MFDASARNSDSRCRPVLAQPQEPHPAEPRQAPRRDHLPVARPTSAPPSARMSIAPTPPSRRPADEHQGRFHASPISAAATARSRRTFTIVVADDTDGIRFAPRRVFAEIGDVPLNVDTSAEPAAGRKDPFELQPAVPLPASVDRPTIKNEERRAGHGDQDTRFTSSVSLILESGKPMIAAQSADPIGDRQVTIGSESDRAALKSRRPLRSLENPQGRSFRIAHRSDRDQKRLFELILSRRRGVADLIGERQPGRARRKIDGGCGDVR